MIPANTNEILWHYTSVDACFKILDSQKFRLTNTEYLNDKSEVRHFYNIFFDAYEKEKGCDITADEHTFFNTLRSSLQAPSPYYVLSLSEAANSLYQWTAYTPWVGGYAIGFKKKDGTRIPFMIDSKTGAKNEYPEKVAYKEKIVSAKELVPFVKYAIEKGNVFILGCLNKHHAYHFEKEWRIAVNSKVHDVNVFFDAKPYILASFDVNDIKEIMVSPKGDVELNRKRIEMYRDKRGLSFEITQSDIPFRSI